MTTGMAHQFAPYSHCNFTITDVSLCTPTTCCWDEAQVGYVPTLAGNAAYLAIFAVLIIPQAFFGIRHRTWGFMVGMICGLVLEVIGYVGRIQLHNSVFDNNAFLIYIVCLTIAPAFITASIYLCLSRIVTVYGQQFSKLKPRTYTLVFITFDFIALLLQAIGGAIASTSNTQSTTQVGINIMIAGLAWQVFSLLVFIVMCADFAVRVYLKTSSRRHQNPEQCNPAFSELRASRLFRFFLLALAFATLTIFIRCVYRVAELEQGFNGSIANDQSLFMALEGPMIFAAVIALTAFHPGFSLGPAWHVAQWHLRGKKDKEALSPSKEAMSSASSGVGARY